MEVKTGWTKVEMGFRRFKSIWFSSNPC